MRANFGDIVKRARLEQRIPLKVIADELGISIPYVSDIEHGYRNPPNMQKVQLWAMRLGLNPKELSGIALLSRGSVDLAITNERVTRDQVAMALARTWENLTPDQERELLDTLERFEGSKS